MFICRLLFQRVYFKKKKDHIEGFAPETLVATMGGIRNLKIPLLFGRPAKFYFVITLQKL